MLNNSAVRADIGALAAKLNRIETKLREPRVKPDPFTIEARKPAKLTSPETFSGVYTSSEVDALRADLVAVSTCLSRLIDMLAGKNA